MEEINVRPLFNRVIVQRDKVDEGLMYQGRTVEIKGNRVYSKAGLELPNVTPKEVEDENTNTYGVILALGDSVEAGLSVGQRIVWGKHSGTIEVYKGVRYEVINDTDILFADEEVKS